MQHGTNAELLHQYRGNRQTHSTPNLLTDITQIQSTVWNSDYDL